MVATSKGWDSDPEHDGFDDTWDGDRDFWDDDDGRDLWDDGGEVEPGGRERSRPASRYRLSARIAISLFGIVALAAVIGIRAVYHQRQAASVDPDTGLAWCQDPGSDLAGDGLGDGFGVENGQTCRVEAGDQLSSASAAGATGGEALATVGEGETGEAGVGPPTPSGDELAPGGPVAAEGDPDGSEPAPGTTADYQSNLAMIRAQTVRNTNQDSSPYRQTPSAELVPENHYGPRSEYLNNPGGNPEQSFPIESGGQFRTGCEFSHFAYDDPIVFPNQPGASHLHMFFGNTDVNAFSTADSVLNSGSATCNGQELNRTGYWAPALFDGQGNVRIPERIVVYYKGEGLANGNAEPFPEGAAMVATTNYNAIDEASGGAMGKFSFVCSDNFSSPSDQYANTIPACDGDKYLDLYGVSDDPHMVLEMNVKFPQCWNGQDPSNPLNFRNPANGSWYFSQCIGEFSHTLVNLEYFINYRVELGENTSDWYLSSDVEPTSRTLSAEGGTTVHADWWGGWHKQTNQMFLDNCVNYRTSAPSGCGFGYLTDGGADNNNPAQGPALKYREQYTGPVKIAASELHQQLCPDGGNLPSVTAAAYCNPAPSAVVSTAAAVAPVGRGSGVTTSLFCHVQLGRPDPRQSPAAGELA